MRLNVATRFAVQDVRPVPCPFGTPGVVFHIARIGVREYQDFAQKSIQSNPFFIAQMRSTAAAQLIAPPPSEEDIEKARVAGKADQVEKLEAQKQRYYDELAKAVDREVQKAAITGFSVQTPELAAAVATHLIRNIEGLTDEESGTPVPVTYTPEVGIELLSSTIPISEPILNYEETDAAGSHPKIADINAPLGQALRLWVIHEASKAERYRAQVTEDAAKN